MAKLIVFECDICKKQAKKIQEVKVTVTPLILTNGEGKATPGPATEATFQICGDACVVEAIKKAFKKMTPETVMVGEGTIAEEAQPL